MNSTAAKGFLAIWSDIAAGEETDYLHWLTREHVQERLGVDGFRAVRVFRLTGTDVRRYFIHYQLTSADVVSNPPYLARLNDPTPWSRRVMPKLGKFARGGGHVAAEAGQGQGGLLAIVKCSGAPPADGADLATRAVAMDQIVAARYLQTDLGQSSISTNEKALRSGDESFAGLLLVEGLTEPALQAAVGALGFVPLDGIYAEVFELQNKP